MEDSQLIAYLYVDTYPGSMERTLEAIKMSGNRSRRISPQGPTQAPSHNPPKRKKADYRSRNSTPVLEDTDAETALSSAISSHPALRLTFKPGPKGRNGLEFGTDLNCDVVLPQISYISQRHCALTFDSQRRLILRDLSSNGTMVVYDQQETESRRTIITMDNERKIVKKHFHWILGGSKALKDITISIVIHGISFRVVVPNHDENRSLYNTNVDRFLQEVKINDDFPLTSLDIRSPFLTKPRTRVPTPSFNHEPIRLMLKQLGTGAFATVKHYWDVSTGLEYAYKEPLNVKKYDRKMWREEADILRKISHRNVVQLIEDTLSTTQPRLILEYMPYGSLDMQENVSANDCVAILLQGLSALVDLHGREDPIVHRDIKPGNILVQSRHPLHIKLADFGLSKASNDLVTFCGTGVYRAPEVNAGPYTPVVDIWSLGVVAFELTHGLPEYQHITRNWCQRIVDKVKACDSDDLVNFLSIFMLVMNPQSRRSASDCFEGASRLPLQTPESPLAPTSTSNAKRKREADDNLVQNDQCPPTALNKNSSGAQSSTPRYYRIDAPHLDPSSSGSNTRPKKRVAKEGDSIGLFGPGWMVDPNIVGSSTADFVAAWQEDG